MGFSSIWACVFKVLTVAFNSVYSLKRFYTKPHLWVIIVRNLSVCWEAVGSASCSSVPLLSQAAVYRHICPDVCSTQFIHESKSNALRTAGSDVLQLVYKNSHARPSLILPPLQRKHIKWQQSISLRSKFTADTALTVSPEDRRVYRSVKIKHVQ